VLVAQIVAAQAFADGGAQPASFPVCDKEQLRAVAPSRDEVQAHRQFTVPTLSYPFSAAIGSESEWGFDVSLRVNETGAITCYALRDQWNRPVPPNESRTQLLNGLGTWRYTPFQ